MKLVYILLALALVRWILIYKVYNSVNLQELKRRSRLHDPRAEALYKVAVYKPELDILLWILGTAGAMTLIIWSVHTNIWLAIAAGTLIAVLVVWGQFTFNNWAGRLAALTSPFDAAVISRLKPMLRPLAKLFPHKIESHTDLYEAKDLIDLLSRQNKQLDNRISSADLEIARNALTFGDKTVGSIMTPRREVKFVKADDQVGPILIDELHKTGFSRFPVAKDSAKAVTPQIVGTLYLNNLIGYDGSGKVKDLMRHEVYFINEDASLRQALSAFLKTHHHLLIVVNSFEEMAGVLSLEDVLEQIIGKQIVDEFDAYENIRAVAAMKAEKDAAANNTLEPEPIAQKVASEPK